MTCDECGCQETIREASGESFCKSCGRKLSGKRIEDEETRVFEEDNPDKKKRTGRPFKYQKAEKTMTTCLGNSSDIHKVRPGKRGQYSRLKKWNSRFERGTLRKLKKPLRTAWKLIYSVDLPKEFVEPFSRLYTKCLEENLIKGRKAETMATVCMYIVSRRDDAPRPVKEFLRDVEIERKEFNSAYRYVRKELDIELDPVTPEELAPMYVNRMGLDCLEQVLNLLEGTPEHPKMGRSPVSVLAGAIYYVTDEDVTQRDVADQLPTTTTTVRKNFKMFKEEMGKPELKV